MPSPSSPDYSRILLLVSKNGYSFTNQAQALRAGFVSLGIKSDIVLTGNNEIVREKIKAFQPQLIVSVGDWREFEALVSAPSESAPVLPWLVADGDEQINPESYNRRKLVLTTSEFCREKMIKNGIRPEIIAVLPEAVDPAIWRIFSTSKKERYARYFSLAVPENGALPLAGHWSLTKALQNKIPVIYTTGGSATEKGAQEVMRALAAVGKKEPWFYSIKIWTGENSFRYALEERRLAEKLGIADRIDYLAGEFSADIMVGLMNLCDIYAAPSRHEGFGLPLVEAQMLKKPVITVDNNAAKETVIDGKTGFIARNAVENGQTVANSEDLAASLKTLLTDAPLRKKMGKQAQAHALKNYSPAVIAERFLEIIAIRQPF